MSEFLKFFEVAIAIALIFIVLIQNKNTSLSLSTMSSSMGEVKKRGAEKILQNMTVIIGILFIINSIALFLINDVNKNIQLSNNDLKINTINTSESKKINLDNKNSINIKSNNNSGVTETK